MGDIANKDEAAKALEVARAALNIGALDKAQRFGEKAMRLFPNDEVWPSSSANTAILKASGPSYKDHSKNSAANVQMRMQLWP